MSGRKNKRLFKGREGPSIGGRRCTWGGEEGVTSRNVEEGEERRRDYGGAKVIWICYGQCFGKSKDAKKYNKREKKRGGGKDCRVKEAAGNRKDGRGHNNNLEVEGGNTQESYDRAAKREGDLTLN